MHVISWQKILKQVAIFAVALLVVYVMGWLFIPFAVSFMVAYLLRRPRDMLVNRLRMSRSLSTFFVLAILFAIIVIAMVFFIPLMTNTISKAVAKLPRIINGFIDFVSDKLRNVYDFLNIRHDINVADDINSYITGIINQAHKYLPNIIVAGKMIASTVLFVALVLILSFYMLYDFEKMETWMMNFVVRNFPHRVAVTLKTIGVNIDKYLVRQMLICFMLFAIYFVMLRIIGIDDYAMCAMITGIMAFVPFFGTLIGLFVTIALSIDTITTAKLYCVLGTYLTVSIIDSNIITPRLIGKTIGVHPFVLLFVICLSGSLFGFAGVALSMPLSIMVVTIAKSFGGSK